MFWTVGNKLMKLDMGGEPERKPLNAYHKAVFEDSRQAMQDYAESDTYKRKMERELKLDYDALNPVLQFLSGSPDAKPIQNATIERLKTVKHIGVPTNGVWGQYRSWDNTITSYDDEDVINHELGHALRTKFTDYSYDLMKEAVKDIDIEKAKKTLGDDLQYWFSPKEIYANLMALKMSLRKRNKLPLDSKYTEENIKGGYFKDALRFLKKKDIVKLLNEIAIDDSVQKWRM